ncbi:hypothetical protein ACTUVN_003432 [Pseudomonas caspiana]
MQASHLASPRSLRWLNDRHVSILLLVLPVALITLVMMINNHGMFVYTLDDPYIHLALAKQIFHGHYGINPSEFSAPSSSIIWPFILAPFAMLDGAMDYAPFILNLLFTALTISPLIKLLDGIRPLNKLIILGGFFIAINIYGLVFSGMEHTLQVYLVAVIACAVVKKEFGPVSATPVALYIALILLPLTRYEGLAVSLPVLAYLFWQGDRRNTVISGAIIFASVVAFSLFLNHLGLGYVASSVLSKTGEPGLNTLLFNISNQIDRYGWVILVQLFICVLFFDRKPLVLMLLSVAVLHTLFGRSGQGRYEIYWLMFVGVFALQACVMRMREGYMTALFGMLPAGFAMLVYWTASVPLASAAIYNQQYFSGEIVHQLHEPVAVNDLGLVALHGDEYILDLWGLGSIEALNYRKTATGVDWIIKMMNEKNVHYAFVYAECFPEIPANWIEVAEMQLTIPRASALSKSVFYYATDTESAKKLRAVMEQFRDQNPGGKFVMKFAEIAAAR